MHALAKAVFGGAALDWPREGALSLKIARAAIAGLEAKQADVNVRIDARGLEIERLAVADFGGAALAIKGRIDTKGHSPRGAVTLDLDARALDGVMALLEKFAPQAAERLRGSAARLTPVSLRASLAVDAGAAGIAAANAKFKVEGRAGGFRLALQGDTGPAGDVFNLENLAALGAAKVNLNGRLDADDGAALIELMGFDRFVAVDKRPARLTLAAKGSLDGELAVDGQLAAGPLNISTNGTARFLGRTSPSAQLNLKVANASVRSPRRVGAGHPAELLPVSATARLDVSEGTLRLSDVAGTVAGTSVGGRLTLGMQQQPMTVDGDVEVGAVDLPAGIALAVGLPPGGASGHWPAEPFEQDLPRLSGRIAVKSPRVMLTPKLAARDVRGVLYFGELELGLQSLAGSVAGGRLAAELTFLRRAEGLTARTHVRLAAVNVAELLPGEGVLSGRLTLDLNAEGTGMSAVALVGSLDGGGTFTLENGRVVRLDPAAFDAVIRAVDQGLPIDTTRVRDRMDAALASGVLAVTLAEGAIAINAGQARLSNTVVHAQRADLAMSGSVDLAEVALDARLTLSADGGTGAPANSRPEITVALKGPIATPKRTIDVAALASWLALRAVEQQSKKLDVLEGRAPAPPAKVNVNPQSSPARTAPVEAVAPKAGNTEPDASGPRPTVRTQPTAPAVQKPKPAVPSAERAPPLPPAIDIRPAPAPRAVPGAGGRARRSGARGAAKAGNRDRARAAAPAFVVGDIVRSLARQAEPAGDGFRLGAGQPG